MSLMRAFLRELANDPALFAWIGLGLLIVAILMSFFGDVPQSDHELREAGVFVLIAIYMRVSERKP